VTAGKRTRISARDPKPAEVEAQSDMDAATVRIGTLAVQEVPGAEPTVLDIEVRYSSAGNGALDVLHPSPDELARVMTRGRSYELSAARSQETTSKFFSEVDLTFTVE
jgi:hypothetical protein